MAGLNCSPGIDKHKSILRIFKHSVLAFSYVLIFRPHAVLHLGFPIASAGALRMQLHQRLKRSQCLFQVPLMEKRQKKKCQCHRCVQSTSFHSQTYLLAKFLSSVDLCFNGFIKLIQQLWFLLLCWRLREKRSNFSILKYLIFSTFPCFLTKQ